MQAKRIFYHRAITVAAVYRPIGYTVLAMMIAAVVIQGCRSGLQYSLSLPSSGAGRQGTPGSLNTLPSAGIDACDVTFAGPTTTLPEEPHRPGFLLKRSMLKVAMGADGFSPLSSAPSRDMADINRARPMHSTAGSSFSDRSIVPGKAAAEIDRLLDAIVLVESSGRLDVVNDGENAAGAYQIRPIFLQDVNRILGCDRYKLSDRFDPDKSRQMAKIFLAHYGKGKNIIQMARQFNGGPRGHMKKATLPYARKISAVLYAD